MQTLHVAGTSFTYPFATHTGFLEAPSVPTDDNPAVIPYSTLQLNTASHLAQFIRAELLRRLGYTSSAGIAPTKLVAKLLSNSHKPALQSVQNPYVPDTQRQSWLDTFPLRKLPGFGPKTTRQLQEYMASDQELVVGTVRRTLTRDDLTRLFPHQGSRLWDLVNGHDPSLVTTTPTYPTQLSVEDSAHNVFALTDLTSPLNVLSSSL